MNATFQKGLGDAIKRLAPQDSAGHIVAPADVRADASSKYLDLQEMAILLGQHAHMTADRIDIDAHDEIRSHHRDRQPPFLELAEPFQRRDPRRNADIHGNTGTHGAPLDRGKVQIVHGIETPRGCRFSRSVGGLDILEKLALGFAGKLDAVAR